MISYNEVYRAIKEQYEKAESDNPTPSVIQSDESSIKDVTIAHCTKRLFGGEAVAFKSSSDGHMAVLFCKPIDISDINKLN